MKNTIKVERAKRNITQEELARQLKVSRQSINAIETGRIALLQCATDGLNQLTAIEDFDRDPSLKYACRDVLKFYKQLTESDIPQVRDFFILEENFLKIQKELEKIA